MYSHTDGSQKHDAKEKKPKSTTVWFSLTETLGGKKIQISGDRNLISGWLGLGFEWNWLGKSQIYIDSGGGYMDIYTFVKNHWTLYSE